MKWYKKDQHFLINNQVLKRIIDYAGLDRSDNVLEIGAGFGNLTRELAKRSGKVVAVEIDPELAATIPALENIEIITGDILKIELPAFNKVVSNLPYSISSPVTFKLLKHDFDLAILMYQYEFAKRMVALPNSKDYGRLTIAIQYYADVELLEVVPPDAFSTPPLVHSAIIRLTPHSPPYHVKDEEFFMKFIKVSFSQRRKKLRNAILNNTDLLGIKNKTSILENLPADIINRRAETLTPEELAEIADVLSDLR